VEQGAAASAIAHIIQLAIAPVFLLAGVGSILNVLANRLARISDRARRLEAEPGANDAERAATGMELKLLGRRITVVNVAISCCTASALFVCLVVAILFVGDLARFPIGTPVAVMFIATMLLLIAGLILFLFEVHLAMTALRARRRMLGGGE
jgi:hypothetical protein